MLRGPIVAVQCTQTFHSAVEKSSRRGSKEASGHREKEEEREYAKFDEYKRAHEKGPSSNLSAQIEVNVRTLQAAADSRGEGAATGAAHNAAGAAAHNARPPWLGHRN